MNLPHDIYEYLLLTCHPYQIKNLYYTCKFLYITDKSLLARLAQRWCWPNKTPSQILTDIPHLTFPNIWKASLFYHPLHALYTDYGRCIDSRSVGKFDAISLYHQACLNGYSELECEGFIIEVMNNPMVPCLHYSTSQVMSIILLASKYKHNYILTKLICNLQNTVGGYVNDDNEGVVEVTSLCYVYAVIANVFMNPNGKPLPHVEAYMDEEVFIDLITTCFDATLQISIDYKLEDLLRVIMTTCKQYPALNEIRYEIISLITTGGLDITSNNYAMLAVIYASLHLLDRNAFIDCISVYIPSAKNLVVVGGNPNYISSHIADHPFFNYLSNKFDITYYTFCGIGTPDLSSLKVQEYIIRSTSVGFFSHIHDYYTYLALKPFLSKYKSSKHTYNRFHIPNRVKRLWLP